MHKAATDVEAKPIRVRYAGLNRDVDVATPGKTLLEVSMAERIPHLHECGGMGKCSTCRVRVLQGHENLSPPNAVEQAMGKLRHWEPGVRLACQARVTGEVQHRPDRVIAATAEDYLHRQRISDFRNVFIRLALDTCKR